MANSHNRLAVSAVHVAFPAPSKEAVQSFVYAAVKAGAKLHGEPRERDAISGYYSAAVIDLDGNSVEAVYRPGASVVASEAGGPTIALLENGSVVSKSSRASTVKAESVAPSRSEAKSRAVSKAPTAISKAPTAVSKAAPSAVSHRSQGPPPSYTTQTVQKTDDGAKAAKTIVGTLIGAAAGAAIAYAMVKGDSQSTTEETKEAPQYTPESHQLMGAPSQVSSHREDQYQQQLRAIEAPPTRSVYTSASGPRSTVTRSVSSKNPRASTIYEGTEFFLDESGRRASDGSIFSIPEDMPLRAIEYPPPSHSSQQRHPCSPSTFISSYAADKPRAGSVHSASTIKASQHSIQRRHSHDDRDTISSHSKHSQIYRASSSHHSSKSQSKGLDSGSTASSTRTARNIPLPTGSSATYYSASPSHGNKSYVSAREVPLPDSVIDLDVNSHVTPDDSISQVGSRSGRSSHSHRSSHSKASKHSSRSKMDEPVKPADSVSQVSRGSQRTIKAGGSQAPSRRGSQVAI